VVRLALLSALVVPLLAACTNTSVPRHDVKYGIFVENLPKHRVFRLNWVEPMTSVEQTPTKLMTFRVKSLEVGPNGWRAKVSFRNDSTQMLTLATGGKQSPKDWGMGVLTDVLSTRIEDPGNYLIAARVAPALPTELRSGQSWSGTFSSPQPPRSRRTLRLVFGTFFWHPEPPPGAGPYFVWVTSHFVRAPGPQGPTTTTAP